MEYKEYENICKNDVYLIKRLADNGLRITNQRLALARILFGGKDRHISAVELYQETVKIGLNFSRATIYNNLNQFNKAGMLRKIKISDEVTHFDTCTSNHYHFYCEDSEELIDIDDEKIICQLPKPPKGTVINGVDVIVRIKNITKTIY